MSITWINDTTAVINGGSKLKLIGTIKGFEGIGKITYIADTKEVITEGLPTETLVTSAIAIPCVAIFTLLAQRFPPPVSPTTMRRITFISLVIIGLGLMYGSVKSMTFMF